MAQDVEKTLTEIASLGLKATALLSATADTIAKLRGNLGSDAEALLTGDPVADASILRAAGVERVINEKWNLDVQSVLDFLYVLLDAGQNMAPLLKKA